MILHPPDPYHLFETDEYSVISAINEILEHDGLEVRYSEVDHGYYFEELEDYEDN